MTLNKFILFCLAFLFSCNNNPFENKKSTTILDTSNISKELKYVDSLDLDTTNYITSDFPDIVNSILYSTSDTLLGYVKKSSIINDKKQNILLGDALSRILRQKGFQIDKSEREIVAIKKQFNKRELISWFSSKSDTITMQVIYWYLGKKYILIWQRYNE